MIFFFILFLSLFLVLFIFYDFWLDNLLRAELSLLFNPQLIERILLRINNFLDWWLVLDSAWINCVFMVTACVRVIIFIIYLEHLNSIVLLNWFLLLLNLII